MDSGGGSTSQGAVADDETPAPHTVEKIKGNWHLEVIKGGHPHQFLIRYLGTLGGDFTLLPIRFVEWRDPECKNYKEQMWRNNIEPKFFIYPHDYIMMKRYIMLALGRAWSRKRCEAYNNAVKIATNKETGRIDNQKLVEAKPKGANPIDWGWFLSFRTEPKKKAKVAQNKENKRQQTVANRGGAKPYNCVQSQLSKELGYMPTRAQIWLHTHRKKDGSFSDAATPLANLMQQYDSLEGIPKAHGSGDSYDLAYTAYDVNYKGEHSGRVRGKSFGYSPRLLSDRPSSATGPSRHVGWSQQTEAAITARIREEMDRVYAEKLQAELEKHAELGKKKAQSMAKKIEKKMEKKMEQKFQQMFLQFTSKGLSSSGTKRSASDREEVGSDDDVNENDFIIEPLDNARYKKAFHNSDTYEDEDEDEDLDKDGTDDNGKGGDDEEEEDEEQEDGENN
ncbi:hypothetical protein LINGRAHAP2_LOCUS27782 [Linum grandiflorum]